MVLVKSVNYWLFIALCLSGCTISNPIRFPASDQVADDSSEFQKGIEEFNQRLEKRKALISNPRHYPKIMHHGKKTEYVVVFTHGLFESPYYMQTLSDIFFARGMNVVLPLLPGHWSQPPQDMDKASANQWLEEEHANIEIAQKLGTKIILAGYSTGAESSIEAYLSKKYEISALLLWAPALGLHIQAAAGAEFGWILGIAGNGHRGIPQPDGFDTPYYAPHAGLVVFDLIKYTLNTYRPVGARNIADMYYVPKFRKDVYSRISVPVFLVDTKIDDIVSVQEIELFYKSISGPKSRLSFDDVLHREITKATEDRFFWRPEGYNKHFDVMVKALTEFLDKNQFGKAPEPVPASHI